jgi:hypothetical protein
MTRVIADVRQAIAQFKRNLPAHIVVPEYALSEIINCAFDTMIFSDDAMAQSPDWTRLHNFHRDFLQSKPENMAAFQEAYSGMVRDIRGHMEGHGLLESGDLAYIPYELRSSTVLLREMEPPKIFLESH